MNPDEGFTIKTSDGYFVKLRDARKIIRKREEDGIYKDMLLNIVDALEAAISTPEEEALTVVSQWDRGYEQGYWKRGKEVKKAAGVVES